MQSKTFPDSPLNQIPVDGSLKILPRHGDQYLMNGECPIRIVLIDDFEGV